MVTSVFGMVLFSQNSERHKFDEGGAGSRCPDCTALDDRIPGLIADRERHERFGIEFDDVRRSSSRVSESLNNLDCAVRRNAHLDGFARRDAREFLQNEPHGNCCRVTIRGGASNACDGGST